MQKNFKNLFLEQSYNDSYEDYRRTLSGDVSCWDFCIITASNEAQADAYLEQIEYRKQRGLLPKNTHFAVIPDKEGKRIGSGGATLSVLKYIKEVCGKISFRGLKTLVIHSGGDSKRIPQYSVCGKLFSPVPRELPDKRRATLFDEIIIATSGIPQRIPDGMFVCSGDVLLVFNPLQLDFYSKGAAAISVKEDVNIGCNHGVFLADDNGNVGEFLHKQSVETLKDVGAVNEKGKVDIDTGAVIFESHLLDDLYALVNTEEKFERFVNDRVRLSFYADFLYPLASNSSLEKFYLQTPEGEFSEELKSCRKEIFEAISKYRLKLLRFSPAKFMHIGTSRELLNLQTKEIDSYKFIGWTRCVTSNIETFDFSVSNSIIHPDAEIGDDSYIEDSYICENTIIGKNCIISGVTLKDITVPDNVVLHGIKLKNGKFSVRMYSVDDNPKDSYWLQEKLDLPLWDKPLFPVCDTIEEAVKKAVLKAHEGRLISLNDGLKNADFKAVLPWRIKLAGIIKAQKFVDLIKKGAHFSETSSLFSEEGITESVTKFIEEIANMSPLHLKLRIYYFLSKLIGGKKGESYELDCFYTLRDEIIKNCDKPRINRKIVRESAVSKLPVRVNFGGGWTDTPPYCTENGGTVLNAAILLDNRLPIEVEFKRLDEEKIVLTSADYGSYKEFYELDELLDCSNPHDPYALQKAVLIACGIIPLTPNEPLNEILKRLGGGIYFSTQVINIPRGSGLGTSSILSAACVKGLYEFLGEDITIHEICNRVLQIEQIMSTGGGWQDQMGGLINGIKLLSSKDGIIQNVESEKLSLDDATLKELSNRFCLIYTGQRRLARNILRKVMGKYIGGDARSIKALSTIKDIALSMKNALQSGDIDKFSTLLADHWEITKLLDPDCTNTSTDEIFTACDDLIDGKMICGAGGSGFLQVVLKKGVTKAQLEKRLNEVFEDSKIALYNCSFYV